jgi:hypothetical protein
MRTTWKQTVEEQIQKAGRFDSEARIKLLSVALISLAESYDEAEARIIRELKGETIRGVDVTRPDSAGDLHTCHCGHIGPMTNYCPNCGAA